MARVWLCRGYLKKETKQLVIAAKQIKISYIEAYYPSFFARPSGIRAR